MSDFALTKYDKQVRSIWDSVVEKSKNGNFLHMRDYMDYHAHRFDEQSVIVEKNGKPVAVFPCNRLEDKIVSHSGLTYAGLIYGNDLRVAEVLEIFHLLAQHYKLMGVNRLIYKAVPHIFHRYPADEDLYALFRMDAQLVRKDISTVILMESRVKFSELRKRAMRKAERQDIRIREGQFFDAYHGLLSRVLEKFESQPVHSMQELQLLKSRFPDKIRLFGAFKDEQLLAGTIVYDFGNVAHTQYLASSANGKDIGALDYLLEYLIEQTFAQCHYFSFGISTEHDGKYLNEGLIFQKEGFGGRGVVHDFYEMSLV